MNLRVAKTREDALALVGLLQKMHAEIAADAPLNLEKAFFLGSLAIQQGRAVIVEQDSEPIASYGLFKDSLWYADVECYFPRWFFILPEHRGSHVLRMMIEDAADFAVEQGARVTLHIPESKTAPKSRMATLCESLGGQMDGALMTFYPKD